MIKFYKNITDYSIKEWVHRHTAKVHLNKLLKEWTIEEIPKGMRYIRVS